MTPKEKALRLCQEFGFTTFGEEFNGGTTLPFEIAKKCAIITVDEILADYEIFNRKNKSYKVPSFWQMVKEELLKLNQ